MFKSLRLYWQVAKELDIIERKAAIAQKEQKSRHAFMMELSAAGYDIVKRPSL